LTPCLRRTGAGNVHLIQLLLYLPFVAMMSRATVIVTDSGGVQEEAPMVVGGMVLSNRLEAL
jgi:UDP-N-acetylglucosamine 2-epimerase